MIGRGSLKRCPYCPGGLSDRSLAKMGRLGKPRLFACLLEVARPELFKMVLKTNGKLAARQVPEAWAFYGAGAPLWMAPRFVT